MGDFFKFFSWFLMLPLIGLRAEIHLDRLLEYNAETCEEALEKVDLSELWDCYLKGQTDLRADALKF